MLKNTGRGTGNCLDQRNILDAIASAIRDSIDFFYLNLGGKQKKITGIG